MDRPIRYTGTVKNVVFWTYIAAIVIWVFIVWGFGMLNWKWGSLALLIPLIAFVTAILSINEITDEIADEMPAPTNIAFCFLMTIPFMGWIRKRSDAGTMTKNDQRVLNLVFLSMFAFVFSVTDFWIGVDIVAISHHIKSIANTISITTLMYAIYLYFVP